MLPPNDLVAVRCECRWGRLCWSFPLQPAVELPSSPVADEPTITNTAVEVREESAGQVLEEVLALLNLTRTRRGERSVDFLRWKYLENPDGNAVVWTLRTQSQGELVGFTACIPRRVLVQGTEQHAWVGADFSIHPAFRTLGPAVKLRRQASVQINAGRAAFLFAHPNDKMAIIHARCGHVPLGEMIQVARPLQLAQKLANRPGGSLLKFIARWGIDPILRGVMRLPTQHLRSVQRLSAPVFDERFDTLFAAHAHSVPVMGVRDSRYLNWRWSPRSGDNPQVLVDLEGGQLQGFAVYTKDHEEVVIRDLFPGHDSRVMNRLITAVVREGAIDGSTVLRTHFLEGNPLIALMRNRYFFRRMEPTTAYVYVPPMSQLYDDVTNYQAWFMSLADRDV